MPLCPSGQLTGLNNLLEAANLQPLMVVTANTLDLRDRHHLLTLLQAREALKPQEKILNLLLHPVQVPRPTRQDPLRRRQPDEAA